MIWWGKISLADTFIHLIAVYGNIAGSFDTNADAVLADLDDLNLDLVSDHQLFIFLPG